MKTSYSQIDTRDEEGFNREYYYEKATERYRGDADGEAEVEDRKESDSE